MAGHSWLHLSKLSYLILTCIMSIFVSHVLVCLLMTFIFLSVCSILFDVLSVINDLAGLCHRGYGYILEFYAFAMRMLGNGKLSSSGLPRKLSLKQSVCFMLFAANSWLTKIVILTLSVLLAFGY